MIFSAKEADTGGRNGPCTSESRMYVYVTIPWDGRTSVQDHGPGLVSNHLYRRIISADYLHTWIGGINGLTTGVKTMVLRRYLCE